MELIQIGENALKVTLTRADMERYEIAFDELDYANAETRRVLGEILAEAERSLGFVAAQDRLYIRAFSDGGGGCELFVRCRLGAPRLCRYKTLAELLYACARLAACRYAGDSRAYIDDGGGYYLLLEGALPPLLGEMGAQRPHAEAYLAEHSRPLCDRAVETLAPLY